MFGLRIGAMGRVGSGLTLNQAAANVRAAYSASPQVWYDPSDLVWNWRRNLLTYSGEFDNAAWTKSNATVTANATTAPDGTTTADALVENTATSVDHFFTQTVVKAAAAVTTYTVTIFAKSFGRDLFLLADGGAFANRARVVFDLSAGTISSAASTAGTFSLASATITADQEGYYRCSLTFTTGTEPSVRVQAYLASGTATTYTGDGTSGIFIWGAQLDLGTTATPYQRITDGIQDYFVYGSALPTLYQDSAGTTPVTAVGQPVGLMLDKSRGLVLGSELVVNGTFAADTNWSKAVGVTISGGVANFPGGLIPNALFQNAGIAAGEVYMVSATVAGTGLLTFNFGGVGNVTRPLTNGVNTFLLAAASGSNGNAVFSSTSFTGTVDDVSVKKISGLHASQPTALSRPVLSSRYNQVLNSGFAGAVAGTPGTAPTSWTLTSATGATDSVSVSDGAGGFVLTLSATAARQVLLQVTPSLPASSVHDFTVTLVATSGLQMQNLVVMTAMPAGATQAFLRNGTVAAATDVPVAGDIIGVRATLSTTAGPVTLRFGVGVNANNTGSASFAKASFVAQNENTLPYQRVTTATDYDADFSKFPPHLVCDGTDDGMVTPSWDLTSTDKVTVVAGIRKLSDAATGAFLELSATKNSNTGVFAMFAPITPASSDSIFYSKGTIETSAISLALASPVTFVAAGLGNISGDTTTIRVNGTQVAQATTDQGTGTYGNYPLYLFRRGGTTLPFNGRFYGLSIIGAALSASDITVLEKFTAAKTGVTVV